MPWGGTGTGFPLSVTGFPQAGKLVFLTPSGDSTGQKDANNVSVTFGAGQTPALTPGTYYMQAGLVTIGQGQSLLRVGGPWDGLIKGIGTGDVIRALNPSGAGSSYLPGAGQIRPYLIDMAGMGSGSSGIHAGDLYNLDLDCYVENPPAGCIAHWLDNQYLFAEQMHGRLWFHMAAGTLGATGVQFDNSANVSGSATGSFDRALLDVMCDGKGGGDLVVFKNGAFIANGRLGIYGNTDYGNAQRWVLTLTGSNAGGQSRITDSELDIGVECNATSGVQPGTIKFGTTGPTGNQVFRCSGEIDFSANNPFAGSNNDHSFLYYGTVYGDTKLQPSVWTGPPFKFTGSGGGGALANGDTISSKFFGVVEVTTSGNVTGIILDTFLPDDWRTMRIMNNGSGSVTFAASGTSNVANGTSCVIQANSERAFTFNPDLSLWFPASP